MKKYICIISMLCCFLFTTGFGIMDGSGFTFDHLSYTPSLLFSDKTQSEKVENTAKRQLSAGGTSVTFDIPKEWENVEISSGSGDKDGVFNLEEMGYGYYLSSLNRDGKESVPANNIEFLSIFIIDGNSFVKSSQVKDEADSEEAIIRNICPDEKIPLIYGVCKGRQSAGLASGQEAHTYVASYGSHRCEFVFIHLDDCIVVATYVYNKNTSSKNTVRGVIDTIHA